MVPLKLRRSRFDITAYYYALPECIRCEPCNDSHPFQAQQVECNGVDAVQPEPSPDDQFQQENIPEPSVCESSALEPGTKPVYYPWGTVSSLLMTSKGEEIIYQVEDDRDRIWARRLEWVVDEHLDRAEDEQKQLQRDFETVLRQSKEAHYRKYEQARIDELTKQLDEAHRTLRKLRQ